MAIGPPGTGKSYTIASLAIDHLQRGESVLIASKTNPAVDIIADKIQGLLGIEGGIVRGGRKEYLSSLKKYLDNVLKGIGIPSRLEVYEINRRLRILKENLTSLEAEIEVLEQSFQDRVQREIKWANYLAENEEVKGFFKRWFVNRKKRKIEKRRKEYKRLWETTQELDKAFSQRNDQLKEFIQLNYQRNIRNLVDRNRGQLRLFSKAIRVRRDAKQEEIFKSIDFSQLEIQKSQKNIFFSEF